MKNNLLCQGGYNHDFSKSRIRFTAENIFLSKYIKSRMNITLRYILRWNSKDLAVSLTQKLKFSALLLTYMYVTCMRENVCNQIISNTIELRSQLSVHDKLNTILWVPM